MTALPVDVLAYVAAWIATVAAAGVVALLDDYPAAGAWLRARSAAAVAWIRARVFPRVFPRA